MSHYFSNSDEIHRKTAEILRRSRFQGNRGVIPTIVLAEFYAQAAKRTGATEAERRFNEIIESQFDIKDLDILTSKRAAMIRHRYQEKIPWGDCLIAATGLESGSEYILTEDPEFKSIKEIKCRKIDDVRF